MRRTVSLLLALVLLLTLGGCGKKDRGAAWQEQYDLGVRYLSDGNYEEAIIAFTAAIEIDPKNADGYIGMAKAHIAMGDIDAALAVLSQGLNECDNPNAIDAFMETSLDKGTQRKTTENELPSLTQCTA